VNTGSYSVYRPLVSISAQNTAGNRYV